jgi:hypothetical protein
LETALMALPEFVTPVVAVVGTPALAYAAARSLWHVARSVVVMVEPERDIPRPASAPAYYLGRSAHLWITAMRPGGRRTASDHLIGALTAADNQRHPGTAASSMAMPVPESRSA